MNEDLGEKLVPAQDEIRFYIQPNGDVVLSRDAQEGEGSTEILLTIPKAYVPRLIELLKPVIARKRAKPVPAEVRSIEGRKQRS